MTSPKDYYEEIVGPWQRRKQRKKLYADYIAALIAAKGTAEFSRQAASGELVTALEALP